MNNRNCIDGSVAVVGLMVENRADLSDLSGRRTERAIIREGCAVEAIGVTRLRSATVPRWPATDAANAAFRRHREA